MRFESAKVASWVSIAVPGRLIPGAPLSSWTSASSGLKKGSCIANWDPSFLLAHMPGEIGDRENAEGAPAPRMLLDNHEPMNPPLLQHGHGFFDPRIGTHADHRLAHEMLGAHAAPMLEIRLYEARIDEIGARNHADGVVRFIDDHEGADILLVPRDGHLTDRCVRSAGDHTRVHPIAYGLLFHRLVFLRRGGHDLRQNLDDFA